jgi:poly(glycerol-phosphate) alpha-glucosyltransferase
MQEAMDIRAYGLRAPVCVIPTGVDLQEARDVPPPPWVSQLPKESRVVLYLGRLHYQKGLRELIGGWAMARKRFPDASSNWTLAIAGWDQGGLERELKERVQQEHLENQVVFTGPLYDAQKASALRHAAAMILPSWFEALPVTVLEAWSNGLPAIVTDACNLSEGVKRGASIEVSPEPSSIAEGLGRLFSMSDAERVDMGSRGKDLVSQDFSREVVVSKWLSVLRWLVERGPMPACVIL